MIGRLTDTAMTSLALALTFEQACWPQQPERYGELRDEARRLIRELGVEGVVVPERQEELLADAAAVTTPVTAHLSAERGRILGDTVALPAFFLQSFALRYAVHAGLENPDAELIEIIEDCVEDLGVDRELARVLEREAGWITLVHEDDDGEPSIRHADVIRAGSGFVLGVLEAFGRNETGLEGVQDALAALTAEVADFRGEFRAATQRLERLVAEGDAEVMAALGELKATLVAEGVDPGTADELTAGDPQGLWERVVRWFGGAQARDAAEAAIWAALDFVPAGTGVKLGIKVAGAIRRALKD
jgi:hypothetical protein